MRIPTSVRSILLTIASVSFIVGLLQATLSWSMAEPSAPTPDPSPRAGAEEVLAQGMTPTKKAEALGIKLGKVEPKYLNHCVKTGKLLFTSGFGSKTKGRLGKDMKVEDGYKAAKECGIEILQAAYDRHGTLDNLRVVKVLGCVNSTPDFYDQPKVINGCSDLFHEIFGAKTDGWHARSALGFAALPNGCAVEIEAIFEIKD
jgi:enamine deaminase RidA (YjgF/YER057c/UK114 family)